MGRVGMGFGAAALGLLLASASVRAMDAPAPSASDLDGISSVAFAPFGSAPQCGGAAGAFYTEWEALREESQGKGAADALGPVLSGMDRGASGPEFSDPHRLRGRMMRAVSAVILFERSVAANEGERFSGTMTIPLSGPKGPPLKVLGERTAAWVSEYLALRGACNGSWPEAAAIAGGHEIPGAFLVAEFSSGTLKSMRLSGIPRDESGNARLGSAPSDSR